MSENSPTYIQKLNYYCVQLVGGPAAAAGAMQSDAKLVVGAGVALAVCAAISIVVQPAVKAERHCQMKTRWRELLTARSQINYTTHPPITPSGVDNNHTQWCNSPIAANKAAMVGLSTHDLKPGQT